MTSETKLQEAIGLVREGRKTEARWLLEELLRTDRANETAWLWYADCVETVDERVLALERCLRHNPNARMARAGLELLRSPRPVAPPAVAPAPVAARTPMAPSPFITEAAAMFEPVRAANEKAEAVFISEPEQAVQAALKAAGVKPTPVPAPAVPAEAPDAAPFTEATEAVPAFELTAEDEWLLSDGAAVFTVSPEALTPEELEEMAARTEAFLAETRPEMRPFVKQARRRARRPEEWQELERTSCSRAPAKRRKNAEAVEIDLTRSAYTTLTALAVVIFTVLLLGAALVLRAM